MDVAGKTFVFRESATVEDTDGSACSFTSGGVTFYGMYADNNRIFYATDAGLSDFITVRDGMGDWEEEAYKQIAFADDEEPFTGTFAVWFAATYVEESTYTTQASSLTAVADAIRAKGGTSAELTYPDGFVAAIANIPAGLDFVGGSKDILHLNEVI